jgi:hypothetical protein|tara:strand:- start:1081 stop:1674 length:594 start_codon:yes stop_codon:yes gene_type:complete
MAKPPVEILDALNIDTCTWLYNFADSNPAAFINDNQVIGMFKDKTIPLKNLHRTMPDPFGQVERVLNLSRFIAQKSILDYYEEYSYPENTELVKWIPGDSMSIHSDNSWTEGNGLETQKGKDHPTKYRTYSAIFYINDDYEGGEIYFPNWDIEIKPKTGSLVIFPSNEEYIHGVKEVKNLNRYSIAVWYAGHEYYAE